LSILVAADLVQRKMISLILLNASTLLVLAVLVRYDILSLYAATLTGWGLLFPLNAFLAWRHYRHRQPFSATQGGRPISLSLYIVAAIFTIAGIAALFVFVAEPSVPRAIQSFVAIVLVSYIWFLLYKLRHGIKNP
jgi:hypothetical protein